MRAFKSFFKSPAASVDENNHVVVHFWPQTDRNSAGHLSLTIVHQGKEYYVSYWHQRDITQCKKDKLRKQYDGIEPYWVDQFKKDCLIEGYRHATAENTNKNARDILKIIEDENVTHTLKPTHSIKLFSLDTEKMLKAFHAYQSSDHKWAFFSGHRYHAPAAFNCSSLVMYLLQHGGIEKLTSGYSDSLRSAGLIMSLITSPLWATSLLQAASISVLCGLAGSVVGGGIDGYQDIQAFMRVLAISKRDSLAATSGITVGAVLFSATQALLFRTHALLNYFTLPANVLSLAFEAAKNEMNDTLHVRQAMTPQLAM